MIKVYRNSTIVTKGVTMKDSYVVRLPYNGNDIFGNDYVLTEHDVQIIKDEAERNGRTIRKHIANIIKKSIGTAK